MSRSRTRRTATVAALAGTLVVAPAAAAVAAQAPDTSTGSSSSAAPYVLPVADGVTVTSLLTAGDSAGGSPRLAGLPDGIGVMPAGRGQMDVLVTHEIRDSLGAVRAHGQKGAYVSKWTVDTATGAVIGGKDLIASVQYWQYPSGQYGVTPVAPAGAVGGHTLAFSRFCSASLTEDGQLLNRKTGNGYDGRLFFGNEEIGDEGRAFGITMDGVAYQLPRLGLFSWENTIVAPTTGDTTVALGNEDGAAGDNGQLRVYVGTKQSTGNPVEKAGLANGRLTVLSVPGGVTTDTAFRATHGTDTEVPVSFAEIAWNANGKAQNDEARAKGISLNRIEDGAFDPRKPNDFYFLTTEGGDKAVPAGAPSRDGGGLWRLRFADVDKPELGGTLTLLLDGSEAPFLNKPDNMTIDNQGNLLLQEDPGGNAHLARIVAYRIADGALGVVAQFDPALFVDSGQAGFLTQDEESSGIVDISAIVKKPNTFLFDAQVHKASADAALVEGGQLLTLTVQSWGQVYAGPKG